MAVGYIKGVIVVTRTEKSTLIPETLREAIAKYQDSYDDSRARETLDESHAIASALPLWQTTRRR